MASTIDTFNKNFERWEKMGPEDAEIIKSTTCKRVQFCESENGLQNLQTEIDGGLFFYHDRKDPIKEAEQWFSTLKLKFTDLIVVYGVGLGYYYDAVAEWLKLDERRNLIFFEDDPEVLRCFLESERAKNILADSQVRIYFIKSLDRSVDKFDRIAKRYIGLTYKLSANSLYLRHRSHELMRVNNIFGFLMNMHQMVFNEYRKFSVPFFINYYLNLFSLPDSYLAKNMWNQFRGVPAIICGAGPSLEKNIDVLKKLQNKALIFGGSTSINAMNAAGMSPHFGVGIDPNPAQLNRIVTNHAFQVPFFVNFRMNSFALNAIHGDHLYVNGATSYDITGLIDKELGIEGEVLPEGYNVINYALTIAIAMGCNPISVVGVDLAYSGDDSYAELTPEHPLYRGNDKFLTKSAEEDLLARKDIHGEPVFTLWKWLMESVWYSKYALEFPHVEVINASEGGIGFPGIENKPLQEVADQYLQKDYDFSGMIHSNVQSTCQMPKEVTHKKISKVLETVKDSMVKSQCYSRGVVEEYEKLMAIIADDQTYPRTLIPETVAKNVHLLDEEIAYRYVLIMYMQHLTNVMSKEIDKLELEKEWLSPEEFDQELVQIHLSRFEFVEKAAMKNVQLIDNALLVNQDQEVRKKKFLNVDQTHFDFVVREAEPEEEYSADTNRVCISDPYLDIYQQSPFEGEIIKEEFSNGKIKSEQYMQKKALHGPSRFYHENGQLLSENWYFDGVKSGKAIAYYPSGQVYSTTGYSDGDYHGPQDYYYADGTRKSHLNYYQGQLDGPLFLFFPNGQLKREINYKKGKRHGTETLWNFEGVKIGEAEYNEDFSTGKACFWSPSGVKMKEVSFDRQGNISSTQFWDHLGREVHVHEDAGLDYFDMVVMKMEIFTRNLSEITDGLEKLAPLMKKEGKKGSIDELKGDVDEIRKEIENLLELNKKMKTSAGIGPEAKEAIWKTPTMQENFQSMMDKVSGQLKQQIHDIQSAFADTVGAIAEQGSDNQKK